MACGDDIVCMGARGASDVEDASYDGDDDHVAGIAVTAVIALRLMPLLTGSRNKVGVPDCNTKPENIQIGAFMQRFDSDRMPRKCSWGALA